MAVAATVGAAGILPLAVVIVASLPVAHAADQPGTSRARGVALPAGLADLAERVRPGVVHVRGMLDDRRGRGREEGQSSVGSGFVIDRAGSIVTNEHVVRGTVDLRVRLYDGREFPACVLGTDDLADVALLKIEPTGAPIHALSMADSEKVRAGEVVVAIGSPFGFAHSVTAGIVSATERVVEQGGAPAADRNDPPYAFFIQTDASINVGNSGGPLIDGTGAVIGVNAAFWGGPQPAAGVGFAIPINVVKMLVPQLRAQGVAPRSFLGVDSQPVTPELAAAFRLPSSRGALVAGVERGSAAAAGGLEVGDVVSTWGGHTLATRDDFRILSQLTPPGSKVKVGLLRDGKAIERQVLTRAGPKPARFRHGASCRSLSDGPSSAGGGPAAIDVGFEVRDLPRARAAEVPGGAGVQVSKVHGGLGGQAKLAVGDIILRVGRTPVTSAEDLRKRLAEWKRDAPLPLLVSTRSHYFWTALRPR
jgi:serine protease Do